MNDIVAFDGFELSHSARMLGSHYDCGWDLYCFCSWEARSSAYARIAATFCKPCDRGELPGS